MNTSIKFRLTLIYLLFSVLFIGIVIHVYLLQIRKYDFFSALGKQQYQVTLKTLPPRAAIYDIKNNLIATEKPIISIFVTPSNIKNRPALEAFLAKEYPHALTRLRDHAQAHFLYITRNVQPDTLDTIMHAALEDIYLLEEPGRYYPSTSLACVVGKTDIDNKGISGLEQVYNTQLAGKPSVMQLEQDARSGHYYFNKTTIDAGVQGTPLHTTLDSTLQFLVTQELQETIDHFQAKEGAALVIDPVTGYIYAMVSLPSIDPNNAEITDVSLLKNRVVTETYEFGSVMKTFLALAALEENTYTLEDLIDCENRKIGYVNGMKLSTWKEHGMLTLSEVVEYSNNIGTAKIAQKIGPRLYDHYRRCGFGSFTGLNFPGQQKGYVTHPKTWSKASLNSLSFGYENRATLLQLARAFCLFSNGGYLPTPTLTPHAEQPHDILYKPETIEQMRIILERTCTQGTAHAAAIKGVTVLGKTGTARLLDETGTYSPFKNIYTFTGIIEKDDYKRVIVTFIKEAKRHDIYASTVAAPLFERIAQKMLIHDHVLVTRSP